MQIQLLSSALGVTHLPLTLKRYTVNGVTRWAAFVPSQINKDGSITAISSVRLCDWCTTKRQLQHTLTARYLADVYDLTAYVNTRWALKLPNWAGYYGALPEIANAMKRAGLITNNRQNVQPEIVTL